MAGKPSAVKTFKATLEPLAGKLNWTGVRVPFDAAKLWGKRGHIRVKGTINGFAFAASLFPNGRGEHFLLVYKKMRQGGRARLGQEASFRLEPDLAKRPVVVPPELERVLAQSKTLRRFFDSLSESSRRWCANEVAKLSSRAARQRRAERVAEQILETIEAERELPPQMQIAMRETPGAHAGWKRMTPLQRRQQLLGIFYYRHLESRGRRIAKAVEMMVARNK